MASEYLEEFEKLNKTTNIYDLGDLEVLIILKDGTNLTSWDDVRKKKDVMYVSEDLSNYTVLDNKYENFKSLKAIVASVNNKVTSMRGMFMDCHSLKDISSLSTCDVSNVTNFSWMFRGCSGLADLSALSDWDVSSVTAMEFMFNGCRGLVDCSGLDSWDVSNVKNMKNMFLHCNSLKQKPNF